MKHILSMKLSKRNKLLYYQNFISRTFLKTICHLKKKSGRQFIFLFTPGGGVGGFRPGAFFFRASLGSWTFKYIWIIFVNHFYKFCLTLPVQGYAAGYLGRVSFKTDLYGVSCISLIVYWKQTLSICSRVAKTSKHTSGDQGTLRFLEIIFWTKKYTFLHF